MRFLSRYILTIVFSAVGLVNSFSQQGAGLRCIGLVKQGEVCLRWVPVTIPVWQAGTKYGYVIKRYTIARDGVFVPDGLSKYEVLTKQPITPITNEDFEKLVTTEPRAVVVQEAIYGTDSQPPVDGSDFAGFMKAYKEIEVRFGIALFMCDLSKEIAGSAGLFFKDKTAKDGERYAYSVSLANIPDGMNVDPAIVVMDAGDITKLPPVTGVQAIFLDRVVKFQWETDIYNGVYTAWIIEKSNDGKVYKSVSDLPLVNISNDSELNVFVYTDSLAENNSKTWYRVKGISPFGEEGPVSDPISGIGIAEMDAYVVIDTAEVVDNKKINLKWRVTEKSKGLVSGIYILRSEIPDQSFVRINKKPVAPETRIFTDPDPKITNYYKIELVGKHDISSESFPYLVQTEDNSPPKAPASLAGDVDSTGKVSIYWMANTERDLLGYKIFRSNSRESEFVPVNGTITNSNAFLDTIKLNSLTKKIFYQIVAVDKHFNNSDYSEILELSKPDTIPPVPAGISGINIKDNVVIISLTDSPSTDISKYELYRQGQVDTIPEKIITWKGKLPDSFSDKPFQYGQSLKYLLKTFDSAGNMAQVLNTIYFPSDFSIIQSS